MHKYSVPAHPASLIWSRSNREGPATVREAVSGNFAHPPVFPLLHVQIDGGCVMSAMGIVDRMERTR